MGSTLAIIENTIGCTGSCMQSCMHHRTVSSRSAFCTVGSGCSWHWKQEMRVSKLSQWKRKTGKLMRGAHRDTIHAWSQKDT